MLLYFGNSTCSSLYSDNISEDELVVTLWDKDNLFKNGFLGMVKIAIGPLMDNHPRDLWYPLEKRSSKSRVKGNIRLWTHLTTSPQRDEIPSFPLPSSFSMPSLSTALDGASTSDSSYTTNRNPDNVTHGSVTATQQIQFQPTLFHSEPNQDTIFTNNTTSTLDESDFLHIEPIKEDKGKGKGKEKEQWHADPPYPSSYFPTFPPSPTPSHSTTHQVPIYYDAYGDPVEDADMIAILRMEEDEKRAKEMEEERLLREYLSTLQMCSVCGSDDGGDPLVLVCDHSFCRKCLASHVSFHCFSFHDFVL